MRWEVSIDAISKIQKYVVGLFILLGQGLALSAFAQQALPKVILRTGTQDNSSSKYDPTSKERPGICSEIIKALLAVDPGLEFRGLDKKISLKRIEASLEKNQMDVFFCMLRSPGREEVTDFLQTPLYSVAHVLLVKKDDKIEVGSLVDLGRADKASGQEVLVHNGSVLLDKLKKFPIAINDSGKTTDQILKMIDTGRGRFLYVQDRDIRYYLKQSGKQDSYRILPNKYFIENQYVAVSKKLDPLIVKRLEEDLKKLKSKGTIEKILAKYE